MSRYDARANRSRSPSDRGRIVTVLAVVGAGAIVFTLFNTGTFRLPDWFGGGSSDPAPRGSVIYEGQEARTASERFLVDIAAGALRAR